jgi:extracellular factor (EF) 3-hydroxypalmitic acid methyl ester biosynthesis protein
LGRASERRCPIEFQKRSVHSILKEAARSIELAPEKQFDLIYCAGLFDYLPDFVCQKLMTVLYSWLAPEAALVGTNVDPSNPIKKGMEHLLDWHLLYRTSDQARTLKPAGAPDDTVSVVSDKTGVNLFMTVRKPRHE